ncbi:M50 family metallopeptidase [Glaciecola sp. MH2013]|uniref:M50 family metallopeptidase n=1 Tax=Glaciecola sp. MH2013 TaxID=2785524 RepID=UPI00189FE089|nr:M50 family metallopeptidase [Glaciecola sp. MH2013]MBF7073494.1 M50 family metallopeptidase [Glaciecola sp. MH2013]
MNQNPYLKKGFYILNPRVKALVRDEKLLLVHADSGQSMSVSLAASCLISPLSCGARYAELIRTISEKFPSAQSVHQDLKNTLLDMSKIGFVSQIQDAPNLRGFYSLCSLDTPAKSIAGILEKVHIQLRHFVYLFALVLSIMAIGSLFKYDLLPELREVITNFSLTGFVLFLLLLIPLHEFSHAIACRMAGIASGRFGIVMHGGILPGPFIDTSLRQLVTSKWKRASIPLVGPLTNLVCAGAVALVIALGHSNLINLSSFHISDAALHTLFLLCISFFYFDSSPSFASDGSHVVETIFENENLRKAALSTEKSTLAEPREVFKYRLLCVLHASVGLVFFAFWLFT